jgi:exodeoxyribonuclease VII large subunit
MIPEIFSEDKNRVFRVSELTRWVRRLLENGLPMMWVKGEISNLTRAASGHWYLSLKDEQAQVRCVMFRNRNQFLDWQPSNGAQVEVLVLATLYEARGDFQLTIELMRPAGLGALYEAFERLKRKLEAEGLFDAVRKRAVPVYPRRIGLVTSPQAAALRDVLTTLRKRMPAIPIVLYPVPVQGEGAAAKIAQAIAMANRRAECDVLIVCRGGGSIEDLWAFNEEVVARAIADSEISIISGIGHETDFTISDFVADLRAATPTAAAQAATPDRAALQQRLQQAGQRLARAQQGRLQRDMQQLDYLQRRLLHPAARAQQQRQHLEHLRQRLNAALAYGVQRQHWRWQSASRRLLAARPEVAAQQQRQSELAIRLRRAAQRLSQQRRERLDTLAQHLAYLDPSQVLARGYSLVQDGQGRVVVDSAGLQPGDTLNIAFAHGSAQVGVRTIRQS